MYVSFVCRGLSLYWVNSDCTAIFVRALRDLGGGAVGLACDEGCGDLLVRLFS